MHTIRLFFLLLSPAFLLTAIGWAQSATTKNFTVYFETDKSSLTSESRATLDEMLEELSGVQGATMQISGHTDARASDSYNRELSRRRIDAVTEYLNASGSSLPELTSSAAEGEKRPADVNTTRQGMQHNRRVEITISYPEQQSEVAPSGNIRELYAQLQQPSQEFCIDNRRDTLLECAQGTLIMIPANAFHQTTTIRCTRIMVREAVSYGDMLEQNLNTYSPEGLLITGGMIEIHAFSPDNKELRLTGDRSLTIFFPSEDTADFTTFYGMRHDNPQQTAEWHQAFNRDEALFDRNVSPLDYFLYCWQPPALNSCQKCRFFFCRFNRMDEGIRGLFDKDQHYLNKEFRTCQRALRRQKAPVFIPGRQLSNATCERYRNLFSNTPGMEPDSSIFLSFYGNYMKERGIKSIDEARRRLQLDRDSVNRAFLENRKIADSIAFLKTYANYMEQKGLKTIAETRQELNREADSVRAVAQKTRALSYNVLPSNRMGMINCDRFVGKSRESLISILTNQPMDARIDGKLIFTDIKSIMPAMNLGGKCGFSNIPEGKKVWALFLKQEDGKTFYFLKEIEAGKQPIEVLFIEASPSEIRKVLHRFD